MKNEYYDPLAPPEKTNHYWFVSIVGIVALLALIGSLAVMWSK